MSSNIMYQLPTGELLSSTTNIRLQRINNRNINVGLFIEDTFVPLNLIRRYAGNLRAALRDSKVKEPSMCDRCKSEQGTTTISPDNFIGEPSLICDRCYDDMYPRSNPNICYAGL